jgi:Xaa-Pro aminopeptidase
MGLRPGTVSPSFDARHRALRDAESKAERLFAEASARNLIRPGISEKTLNTEVYELAFELFGIRKYWHKRIVRAGANTLCPYKENPPDLVIGEDDILFFDFGPVFEEWEADVGRTFVLGNDETKLRLQRDIEEWWWIGKRHFDSSPDITGRELRRFVLDLCGDRGWEYIQDHCGHLIGNFPHETVQGEEVENYIHLDNRVRMRDTDKEIGGFFEQLLTVD